MFELYICWQPQHQQWQPREKKKSEQLKHEYKNRSPSNRIISNRKHTGWSLLSVLFKFRSWYSPLFTSAAAAAAILLCGLERITVFVSAFLSLASHSHRLSSECSAASLVRCSHYYHLLLIFYDWNLCVAALSLHSIGSLGRSVGRQLYSVFFSLFSVLYCGIMYMWPSMGFVLNSENE